MQEHLQIYLKNIANSRTKSGAALSMHGTNWGQVEHLSWNDNPIPFASHTHKTKSSGGRGAAQQMNKQMNECTTEGVEAGDEVGREAIGIGEEGLEADGLVVTAVVEELVKELEGGEEIVLVQQEVDDAVAQRRLLHVHGCLIPPRRRSIRDSPDQRMIDRSTGGVLVGRTGGGADLGDPNYVTAVQFQLFPESSQSRLGSSLNFKLLIGLIYALSELNFNYQVFIRKRKIIS